MHHDPPPRSGRNAPSDNRMSGRTWPLVVIMIGLVAALAYQYRSVIPVEILSVAALLALCGGMHFFMHRGMGHDGNDPGGHGQADRRRNRPMRHDDDWPDDDRGVA